MWPADSFVWSAKCLKIRDTSCQHFQCVGCSYKVWNSGLKNQKSWNPLSTQYHLVAVAPLNLGAPLSREDICFLGHQFPLDNQTRIDYFPGLHGHWSLLPLPCPPRLLLCAASGSFSLPVCSLVCWKCTAAVSFQSFDFLSSILWVLLASSINTRGSRTLLPVFLAIH